MTSKTDHGGRNAVRAVLLLVASCLLPQPACAAEQLGIELDQATIMKLPEKVSTIVVGNPLIADVTLQPGGLVVVTGKGYGATNMIAMDRTGTVLADRSIQVIAPSEKMVTVFRGVERESYSCAPICQRRVTLGDNKDYFEATLGQTGNLSGQATSAAAKP